MAIYFNNTLARTADFIKISDRYASIQSILRGNKRGRIHLKLTGKTHFAETTAEQVGKLYSVASWQGLNLVAPDQLPTGMTTIGQISKKVGPGEAVILEWALFNLLNVYRVSGIFFAEMALAKQVAATAVDPARYTHFIFVLSVSSLKPL